VVLRFKLRLFLVSLKNVTMTDVKAETARLLEILPVRDININWIGIKEIIKQIYEQ